MRNNKTAVKPKIASPAAIANALRSIRLILNHDTDIARLKDKTGLS